MDRYSFLPVEEKQTVSPKRSERESCSSIVSRACTLFSRSEKFSLRMCRRLEVATIITLLLFSCMLPSSPALSAVTFSSRSSSERSSMNSRNL